MRKGYTPQLPNEAQPTEASRQDRRIIAAKLDEVYVDENTGYSKGWSDEKVSTDLGVPRAWVASVRDDLFGPNKSEEVAACVTEARKVLEQMSASLADMGKMRDGITTEISKFALSKQRLERQVEELSKRA